MNQIKETIERLKRIVDELSILRGVYSNDQLALLQSIQWGEELLKKETLDNASKK